MRRDGKSLGQMVKEELNSAAGVIGAGRDPCDHDHPAGGAGAGGGEGAGGKSVGRFHRRRDDSHRDVHGRLSALSGASARCWKLRSSASCCCCSRCGAGNSFTRTRRWRKVFTFKARTARLGDHRLRIRGQRAAGLAAARAARLPEHVHEAGHDLRAGARRVSRAAGSADAGASRKFIDGSGPVVAGKLFPFCFITIACGAISGFHTLIASGTTPKIITRESYARPDRLRRDVPGIARGDHGADRRLHARTGRLSRA